MRKIALAASLLAPLLLAAPRAAAYNHAFSNETDRKVRFRADYAACPGDSWDVKPGETITWRSGLCCLKSVNADIGASAEKAQYSVISVGSWTGTLAGGMPSSVPLLCGKSNWKIDRAGPTGAPILESY